MSDAELVAEPEPGVALAEALVQSGGWDRALRLAEPCRRAGGGRLERRRLSVEGQLLYARGHVVAATRVWGALLDSAAASAGHEAAAARLYDGLHAPRRTTRLRSRLADERRRQGNPGPSEGS